jgi:hypothetical protein
MVDLRCFAHMGASTTSGPDKAGLTGMGTEVSTVLSILHARSVLGWKSSDLGWFGPSE